MRYPRQNYLIIIYDITGTVPEGLYVGSAHDVTRRIQNHLHNYTDSTQKKLHQLMRFRKYSVHVLDDSSNEYDWIDFFKKKSSVPVFNVRTTKDADWHRLEGKEELKQWLSMC